jgi:hypothetical protein
VHVAPLTLLFAIAVSVAAASACGESFPAEPPATNDASLGGGVLEAQPPAIVPQTTRVHASSSSVAFDALRGAVWTANGDVGTVSYVDPVTPKVLAEIPVGQDIRSVAVSPDGAWIAAVDRAGGSVTLIDASTRIVQRTLTLGTHPRACVWDPANPRWLYVTEEDAGAVAVVDRTLGTVVGSIPVGRLPAGIAASAKLHELYVTHRIDADVTVVDLGLRQAAADISLADEPFSGIAVPNGKPTGFEGIAIATDGAFAWAPHELLSTTHPFVFNETVFPAISVVDLNHRVEAQTDPNSNDTGGRKNLFAAIDIQDDDGQPDVFSQPCAVAMHPNGEMAWALMCGSQDLLGFTVVHGTASYAQRNLPCDHPSGLTLDATGARAFVMCDQSKQLVTFDTAAGSPVGRLTQIGSPLTVAADTVAKNDPQLRQGLTLFYQANSSKGALATTGNDWMSCSACHLDGFGSTNLRLFEALLPKPNEALDATIGHVGLKDEFSTTIQVGQASFEPHDVLVALLDQGGLAPDRRGANRTGQVDPNAPPSAATDMAAALARIVAGDLPNQPTWLKSQGAAPDATYVSYDAAWCGGCHATEYAAWKQSLHAHAAVDPMMLFAAGVEADLVGSSFVRLCAGCHDPVSTRIGDTSLKSGRGVTCLGCHDVTALTQGGGNADLQTASHDWTQDHEAWATQSLDLLRKPEFCGGCHQQFVPGTGFVAIATLDEHATSLFADSTRCVDCHMKPVAPSGYDHRFPGGNVYMGQRIGDATLVAAQTYNLQHVVQLQAQAVAGGVLVTVRNAGAGHWFPTGVTDIREPWIEIQPKDAGGQVLAHIGGPASPSEPLPAGAARLGIDIADADGEVLLRHELSIATRVPFDVRVPSGEGQALFVPVGSLPAGTASVDAVLIYRNVRTSFYRAATGSSDGAAPETEMARVPVEGMSP